jgi:hypothetical protein
MTRGVSAPHRLRDVAILFDQHPGLLMEDAGYYSEAQRERLTRRER